MYNKSKLNKKYIIYLDQNKWSDIMKTLDNPMYMNGSYKAVVQKIIEKSKSLEWIFPASYTHFTETITWENRSNGYKLGNTMDAISNRYTMPHFYIVLKDEIARVAQGKDKIITYITQGDPFAFTGSKLSLTFEDSNGNKLPELEKEFQEFFDRLNIYGTTVNSGYFDRNEIERTNKDIYISMEGEKDWYLGLPQKDRTQQYKVKSFNDLYTAMELDVLSNDIITCDEKLLCIIEQIKSFDIYISLKTYLYQNKDGRIDINDNKDIYFFSVAIPYCDIVIAEKKWTNVIKSLNLDKKYNVIVEKDLNCLMRL